MKLRLAAAALPMLLGGCLPLPITIATTTFTGISYVASGKSTTDHVLSATMEQDCALTRPVFGEPFCRDVGPDGEGRTLAVAVASYPGDRDESRSNDARLAARERGALDLSTLVDDSRQVAAAPRFLVAPPRVSIAGIVVAKDQLIPAPGSKVLPAVADNSWSAIAPPKPAGKAVADARPRATAVALSAPAATVSKPGGDRWVVLGSFRTMERARDMAARYASRDPRIFDISTQDGQWHRVAIGPLTPDAARSVRDGLGVVDGRQPWVVRVEAP